MKTPWKRGIKLAKTLPKALLKAWRKYCTYSPSGAT
jgi:hypothetical protein